MLTFVLRKMLNNKWMIICLLIGNILLASVVAAVPLYSDAILQRVLTQELEEIREEERLYPGTIEVAVENRSEESFASIPEVRQV